MNISLQSKKYYYKLLHALTIIIIRNVTVSVIVKTILSVYVIIIYFTMASKQFRIYYVLGASSTELRIRLL